MVLEWHAEIQHAGRRERVSLGTNERGEASRKAAALFKAITAQGWDVALADFAPDRAKQAAGPPLTVGEFLQRASAAITANVSPRTLKEYQGAVRHVVALTCGLHGDDTRKDYVTGGAQAWRDRIDRVKLVKLTSERIQAAINRKITAARGNPLVERRTRTTAASMLRSAKALFTAGIASMKAQAPHNPLADVKVGKAKGKNAAPKYRSTIDAGELLRAASTELKECDPESYKALLLALGAGLRRAEIDSLKWQSLDAAKGIVRVTTTDSFAPKSEDSDADVFVDAAVLTELDAFRASAKGLFILESPIAPRPQATYAHTRAKLTFQRLTKWLRDHGVTSQKPLHELRKEFGSIVNALAGIHAASSQLRHSQIGTTSRFYADSRRKIAPPIGDMLAGPAAKPEAPTNVLPLAPVATA